MEGSIDAVRERAIPFGEGEEVLVQIVEPHMYNVDDAVAKVGGYVVSVTNGGRFVGEKKLVRIERAGRTSASAVLVGPDAVLPADAAAGGGGGATGTTNKRSSRRRRGARARAEQAEVERTDDDGDLDGVARDERAEPDAAFDDDAPAGAAADADELEEAADEVAEAAREVVDVADRLGEDDPERDREDAAPGEDDEDAPPRPRRRSRGRGRRGRGGSRTAADGEAADDVSSPVRRRTGGARRSAASPEDLASGETAEPISSE
jgi:ribonuclease G